MTLIIGAMTHDCVVLVSDRRLTDGRTGQVITDAENKAVVLFGQLLLGYTGLARLADRPTEQWIISTLAGQEPHNYLQILAKETSRAVRRYPQRFRHHAYLMMGWLKQSEFGDLVPVAFISGNFIRPDGGRHRTPTPSFTTSRYLLGSRERAKVLSVGHALPNGLALALERLISRYAKQNPGRPQGIVDLLVRALVRVADSSGGTVGKNVMIASYPKRAFPVDGIVMLGGDWTADLRAIYWGEGSEVMQYAPAIVSPQIAMHGGEVWTTRPPWWRD